MLHIKPLIRTWNVMDFNIAEIDDGIITPEHADYLRKKLKEIEGKC